MGLPIANIETTSDVHESLKTMIDKLPKADEAYTFDFDYYELSMEQLHTYTIFSQSVVTIIVIVNSILLGVLYFERRKQLTDVLHTRFKNSVQPHSIRDSIRKWKRSLQGKSRSPSPPPVELQDNNENTSKTRNARGQTNADTAPPAYAPKKVYPALPRYRI